MNRLLRIVLVMLAPATALLVMAVSADRPEPPAKVQSVVSSYVRYLNSFSARAVTVRQIVHATRPLRFNPLWSKATFGDSVIFQTTHNGQAPQAFKPPITTDVGRRDLAFGNGALRPLPFPPADVWCVRLNQAGRASSFVAFVGLHQDLFNGEWILHESTGESVRELSARLSSVGCEFDASQ